MARPLRIEFPGAFYHITSRGNERKPIFYDGGDRTRFLHYLNSATERYSAVIHTYCLMKNHYHILLETPEGNLSRIMLHINGAYTAFFNKKWDRAGHLFQGRYKSIVVDSDSYLFELSRYIHLNPLRAGLTSNPFRYRWSSLGAYTGQRAVLEWLNTGGVLSPFGKTRTDQWRGYTAFIREAINRKSVNPLEKTVASTILGNQAFVDKIKKQVLRNRTVEREIPSLRELRDRPDLDSIIRKTNLVFSSDSVEARRAALFFCHRYSGEQLKAIASCFGIGESAVSQASRRFAARLQTDRRLGKIVNDVFADFGLSRV
jgi:REP element-mobilizing transposase RayT